MMGISSFLGRFGAKQVQKVGQGVMQVLVAWDPETASQVEIAEMEKHLDGIVSQVAKARQDYNREQQEADEIVCLYNQRLAAAEKLQKDLTTAAPDKATQIEEAISQLLGQLESMQAEVETEKQEAEEAKAFMNELEQVAQMTADKLKTARQTLEKAKRDMQKAAIEQERAADKAQRAAQVAGLRDGVSQLGSALDAMKKNANDARTKAEASNLKANLLQKPVGSTSNALIDEALKNVTSEGTERPSSIADRLAALKK